jgi:hypothetical protein
MFLYPGGFTLKRYDTTLASLLNELMLEPSSLQQESSKGVHDAFRVRLVLAPHMDDDAIGMGGTIAYLSENGVEIYVTHLTDGGGNYSGG